LCDARLSGPSHRAAINGAFDWRAAATKLRFAIPHRDGE